jgi:hypothetical protein
VPTDQAPIERFWSHIKAEWPHLETISDAEVLAAELERVRSEYNGTRLHAAIGYVTPDDEYEGRGDAIRQARQDGLVRADQVRRTTRRSMTNNQPPGATPMMRHVFPATGRVKSETPQRPQDGARMHGARCRVQVPTAGHARNVKTCSEYGVLVRHADLPFGLRL